jgi:hypothetical protein
MKISKEIDQFIDAFIIGELKRKVIFLEKLNKEQLKPLIKGINIKIETIKRGSLLIN